LAQAQAQTQAAKREMVALEKELEEAQAWPPVGAFGPPAWQARVQP
jgi:hypothetical protein